MLYLTGPPTDHRLNAASAGRSLEVRTGGRRGCGKRVVPSTAQQAPVSVGHVHGHALDVGTMIYGDDGLSGRLLASDDGHRWTELWDEEVVDIAASPKDDEVLATTAAGDLVRVGADRSAQAITSALQLFLLDWESRDTVVGVDADGQLWRSRDTGNTWTATGEPLGAPQAMDAAAGRWHVATADAILSSTDQGQNWTPVVGLSAAGG